VEEILFKNAKTTKPLQVLGFPPKAFAKGGYVSIYLLPVSIYPISQFTPFYPTILEAKK
jgi:hypothetical protein